MDDPMEFLCWTPEYWEKNREACQKYLEDLNNWNKVPSLNAEPLHNFKDRQLVRFTGMIQDMHNPEFFLSQYEVRNSTSGQTSIRSGNYCDVAVLGADDVLVQDSPHNQNAERQTFYCVSVPGLNNWVIHQNSSKTTSVPCSSHNSGTKRSFPEDACDGEDGADPSTSQSTKQARVQAESSSENRPLSLDLNLPLPDPHGRACLMKVYEGEQKLSLNEVVEAVGFLSVDPELTNVRESNDDDEDDEMDMESIVHNPPASLVPRLHAVKLRLLHHCNPLVDDTLNNVEEMFITADSVRQELRLLLTQLLLGDQLAADYLICHLISTVYQRRDLLALGQFSLNISNVCVNEEYTSKLYSFLEKIVTKSHYFPMTLQNLNTTAFIPKKDYEGNRLLSGALQLSAHTHLVLDETSLEPGQLDDKGVHNIAALATLISQQKLDYDFQYYKLEFLANIPVLVLSEGKSLLPSDVRLPLEPDQSCVDTMNEIFEAADQYLKEPLLSKIRAYLTTMRLAEYSMPEELEKVVQEDFVKLRREERKTSATDLHRLLVLARLVSLSKGERTLSGASWELANNMERLRKERLGRRRQSS